MNSPFAIFKPSFKAPALKFFLSDLVTCLMFNPLFCNTEICSEVILKDSSVESSSTCISSLLLG